MADAIRPAGLWNFPSVATLTATATATNGAKEGDYGLVSSVESERGLYQASGPGPVFSWDLLGGPQRWDETITVGPNSGQQLRYNNFEAGNQHSWLTPVPDLEEPPIPAVLPLGDLIPIFAEEGTNRQALVPAGAGAFVNAGTAIFTWDEYFPLPADADSNFVYFKVVVSRHVNGDMGQVAQADNVLGVIEEIWEWNRLTTTWTLTEQLTSSAQLAGKVRLQGDEVDTSGDMYIQVLDDTVRAVHMQALVTWVRQEGYSPTA